MVYYMPVCIYCGKIGSSGSCGRVNGPPKKSPPSMSGPCPFSPNKKHAPGWQVDPSRK